MKGVVKKILWALGLYVKPMEQVRFGVEWSQDIRYLLNGKPLELVVDVGANIGQTICEVLKYFPKSHIYCFEPVPSTFQRLSEQIDSYPNVFPFNLALGDQLSTCAMTAKPCAEQNTLVFDVEMAKHTDTEMIDVKIDTLDRFCVNNGIDKIDLLKVDTEGYELKVLKGAEQLLSSKCIDYILIECDFLERSDEPHGNFVEILNYLQLFHFNVVAFYTGGIDNLGWKWGDVLFRRILDDEPSFFAMSPFWQRSQKN
uniref:FkbM family methyltransferase n=1 Tax=Oscillatoriales cyanobacterium SpSt-402 TaxID=2282168 RepID=A0A832M253_9CYAN